MAELIFEPTLNSLTSECRLLVIYSSPKRCLTTSPFYAFVLVGLYTLGGLLSTPCSLARLVLERSPVSIVPSRINDGRGPFLQHHRRRILWGCSHLPDGQHLEGRDWLSYLSLQHLVQHLARSRCSLPLKGVIVQVATQIQSKHSSLLGLWDGTGMLVMTSELLSIMLMVPAVLGTVSQVCKLSF